MIARAIRTEMERGGQVYFVNNRVESIYSLGNLITRLVPEARVGVGHGQMNEEELERVMVDFVAHKYDVLLATTIIENGLDIPNANTIIVNRADRFGLSQLYQLRGRVGRSDRRAYAYLLVPPEDTLSPVAKKRLAAIREFSDLGSGFRVAALDLEIRGAGNLLGGEQSGHIEAVGFDMYMKLLEQTIKELKGEEIEDDGPRDGQPARRPAGRRDVHSGHQPASDGLPPHGGGSQRRRPRRDHGRSPGPLRPAAGLGPESRRVRCDPAHGGRLGLESLDREGQIVVLKFRADAKLDPAWLFRVVQSRGDVALLPPATLKLDLQSGRAQIAEGRRATRRPSGKPRKGGDPVAGGSWWAARARAGEVTPGFTRDEIMRPAKEDPRAKAAYSSGSAASSAS